MHAFQEGVPGWRAGLSRVGAARSPTRRPSPLHQQNSWRPYSGRREQMTPSVEPPLAAWLLQPSSSGLGCYSSLQNETELNYIEQHLLLLTPDDLCCSSL